MQAALQDCRMRSDAQFDSQAVFSCKPLKLVLAYFAEVHINLQTICNDREARMFLVPKLSAKHPFVMPQVRNNEDAPLAVVTLGVLRTGVALCKHWKQMQQTLVPTMLGSPPLNLLNQSSHKVAGTLPQNTRSHVACVSVPMA